jgi:hypothetical protein
MQFVYQALTWGFLLALVPLLIHLINMMRHRRVKWAAMEFLLASYRKHRQWIWLKQLLLLLARMAAVALVVAMVAQLKTRDQWLALFGNRVTHHYVLLDDSYSMGDRVAGASAFDAAKQVVSNIVNRAKNEDSPQKLTLLRYSQARGAAENGGPAAASSSAAAECLADFNAQTIDGAFDLTLEKTLRTMEPTALSLSPRPSLAFVRQLLAKESDETSVVYVLSDFRRRDWDSPAELKTILDDVQRHKAQVHFVSCARSQEPNLGIVEIAPTDDTRAAGVPLFVNVRVKNFGSRPVTKVQVKVQQTYYAPDDPVRTSPEQLQGIQEELVTLLVDQIGPQETVTRRVQVYFPQPGRHVVEASLPEDPVESDNHRWCVIDFPDGERVLVVDGSVEQQHAYYLEVAFRPLERSNTGIRPDVRPPAFLRDATPELLSEYAAVYLLNVPRLEERAAAALEEYVAAGGGVAIFGGPDVNVAFYNSRLYKQGKGLLPAPLAMELEMPLALDPAEPDLEPVRHPIFSFFLDQTNPLLRSVKIDRYLHVTEGWKPEPDSGAAVLVKLRHGSPLVLEKKLGKGVAIAVLTTAAPQWNDWAKNPSYVVTLLKMQSYLAASRRRDDPRLVGTPLDVSLQAAEYRTDLSFVVPGEGNKRARIDRQAVPSESGAATITASLGRGSAAGRFAGETDRPGIYEAWAVTTKGAVDVRRWALNVEPDEGDLATVVPQELAGKLEPVKVTFHQADQYEQEEAIASGYNLSQLVMVALVCLLLGEQLLAYSASYHPAAGGSR